MARLVVMLLSAALLAGAALPAAAPAADAAPRAEAAAKKKSKKRKSKARAKCPSRRQAAKLKRRGKKVPARCRKRRKVAPKPRAPAAPAPRPRKSYEQWSAQLSQERFSRTVKTRHYLTAKDGTTLSVRVHLPAELPSGERLPALFHLTPYGESATSSGLPFVKAGAAYVELDARGTGGSGACLDFGGSADRSDALEAAEWIRKQPWSNGRIVTDGVSHPGMGSVVAHAAIPGLTGALTHAPVISYYQDEWLQGAKFEDQFNGPFYQLSDVEPPPPDALGDIDALRAQAAACNGSTARDFSSPEGTFTPMWADRDLSRHPPAGRVPILLTHGFIDHNVHPDHTQLYWDALPEDYPKFAIFGFWFHGWPKTELEFRDVRHRWLDALLFGTDNGVFDDPRVLVQDDTSTLHEGNRWPLEPSQQMVFHPATDGTLRLDPSPAGSASYPDLPGAVRGSWTGSHVSFKTEPLDTSRLVNGAPTLDLVASSTATETKWVAYVYEVTPAGERRRVTHGYADSHTWGGEDKWLAMERGKPYRWRLRLFPTAVIVDAGNRLELVIASQDSRQDPGGAPCYHQDFGCYRPSGILPASTVGQATNTVHLGANATALRLHWVDPAKTAKPPFSR